MHGAYDMDAPAKSYGYILRLHHRMESGCHPVGQHQSLLIALVKVDTYICSLEFRYRFRYLFRHTMQWNRLLALSQMWLVRQLICPII